MTWLQKIGFTALMQCGVKDVDAGQQTFLAEYLTGRLKLPEFQTCVKALLNLFNINAVPLLLEHLTFDISEFACSCQQMLDPEDRPLVERHAAYELAVGLFEDAEKPSSGIAECQRYLCNLMLGYPKGRKIVDDAKLLWNNLDRDVNLLANFKEVAQKFKSLIRGSDSIKAFRCSF